MPERLSLKETQAEAQEARKTLYALESRPREFFSTGCTLLDKALGGGWAMGRIANIIGDKSTGKTLLCIEAAANFARKYPNGRIYYREAEAAFDEDYAATLGMPTEAVDFGDRDAPLETVEDMFEDIDAILKKHPNTPSLYILDSLDALSDRAELKRDADKGSYGADKAKWMSKMFRILVRKMAKANMTIIIVSQIRDKIGVMFGRKWTRTGGHALDFYATHIIVLAHMETLTKTIQKVKRAIGIGVKAKVEKNKVSNPFREVQFPLIFGYGIDDEEASLDWLDDVGVKVPKGLDREQLKELVVQEWDRVEESFAPKRRKYSDD